MRLQPATFLLACSTALLPCALRRPADLFVLMPCLPQTAVSSDVHAPGLPRDRAALDNSDDDVEAAVQAASSGLGPSQSGTGAHQAQSGAAVGGKAEGVEAVLARLQEVGGLAWSLEASGTSVMASGCQSRCGLMV
jgi:hypothetical protein